MEYEVTAPDGRKFRVTAPEGATQEQVLEYAKANFSQQQEEPKQEQRPNPLLENAGRYLTNIGPWGGIKQLGQLFGAVEEAADVAGGATVDLVSKVAPPEAAAAAGTAVKMAPTALGGIAGRLSGAPMALTAGAQKLMHSALKPSSKDIISGDAGRAIDTLLKEGANISSSGAAKLRTLINKLSSEVASRIAASPATVDKAHAASEVYKTLQKFKNQVNPGADTKAILASWDEFSKTVANKIPVQEAQALKQGTYKVLSDKYAKMGAVENEAATQAQMAMARGLRKGIEEAVPGVGKLNAQESALINALELAEKRAGIAGNKDVGGIAFLANNPAAAAAMMADRSAAFKSWLANKIYQHKSSVPAGVGAGTAGVYQASQQ